MIVPDFELVSDYLQIISKDYKWLGQQKNTGYWYIYVTKPQPYPDKNGWFTPEDSKCLFIGKSTWQYFCLLELVYD